MKVFRNLLVFTIAILTFSLVSVNAQSVSDSKSVQTIERKIFKKILALPYYGVFDNIKFEVNGSTVTLYGKVYNGRNKSDAEGVVEDIEGVREVINNIEILPPSSFDDSIRRQMVRSFYRDGGSLYRYLQEPRPSVRIIVENGRVTLTGYVANKGDYNLANVLANGISGVFSVQNELVVGKEQYR